MSCNLVYIVSLVIVVNCVISVAKNSDEKVASSSQNVTDRSGAVENNKLNEFVFAEGGSSSSKRIVARKGVSETSSEIHQDAVSSVPNDPAPPQPVTNTTVQQNPANLTVVTSTTTSTSKPATKPTSTTTTMKVTTTTVVTTTKKLIRKPLVTHSADDDPEILASEKNINYNTSKIEDVNPNPPKISQDTDRTIVDEENRTRRNYIIYMGLALTLPMAFGLIHILYKKIRDWRQIRHYQRVVSYSILFSHLHANQHVNAFHCRTF